MASNPGGRPANWHEHVFFGLHYDLHAGAKDTELGAALTAEHLKAELEKVRPDWVQCDCKGHPGYTSWPTRVGSTSPGVVKDALRIHREVTREMGIPLVMHYSGVWDSRAIELHPDWAAVDREGKPSPNATCNLGPYTEELMIPQLLEVIDNYDVDGFWVDGENWATIICYCERCRKAFTAQTGLEEIPQDHEQPHWLEWAAFHRRNFEERVRRYTEAVHARKPTCMVCSNWMYTLGQPGEIKAPVDYLSGDFSPAWGQATAMVEGRVMAGRALSWNLMAWGFLSANNGGWTFKPVAHLCQEAATVISLGGAFQIYDNPQRSGHLTGWHQDALAQVGRFCRARQPWCQGTRAVPDTAVLHAASHFYGRIGNSPFRVGLSDAAAPVAGALSALLENGRSVEILGEAELLARINDFPLVVIPEQTNLPAELREAVTDYVRQGGTLLLSGANVAADWGDLAGVKPNGEPKEGDFFLQVGEEATTVQARRQPVAALAGTEVLRSVMRQQEPGLNTTEEPAITRQGKVLAIHSDLFAHYHRTHFPRTRRLVGELLDGLQANLPVRMHGPSWAHLSLRRQPGRLIVHLVNMGSANPLAPDRVIVEEVPPAGPVTLHLRCDERPSAVYLAPSMEGLTWEWHDADRTLEVRVASVGIMDSVVVEE